MRKTTKKSIDAIDKFFETHPHLDNAVDVCAVPLKDQKITALRRQYDNSIYAYQCDMCGSAWKVYQQRIHFEGCPYV